MTNYEIPPTPKPFQNRFSPARFAPAATLANRELDLPSVKSSHPTADDKEYYIEFPPSGLPVHGEFQTKAENVFRLSFSDQTNQMLRHGTTKFMNDARSLKNIDFENLMKSNVSTSKLLRVLYRLCLNFIINFLSIHTLLFSSTSVQG